MREIARLGFFEAEMRWIYDACNAFAVCGYEKRKGVG